MNTKAIAFTRAAIVLIQVGCASRSVTTATGGPGPISPAAPVPKSRLQVFSDTETHQSGDNTYYQLHTGYNIYDSTSKQVKYVSNHIGDMDECPSIVTITAGNYKVAARSLSYGRVIVPVVIQEGRTTVIHLDRDWKPAPETYSNQLVRLPNGEAVGWNNSNNKLPQ
jgi:hypothetical protein